MPTKKERDNKDAYTEELKTLKAEMVAYGEESVLIQRRLRRSVLLAFDRTSVSSDP